MSSRLLDWRFLTVALTGAGLLLACVTETGEPPRKRRTPVDPGAEFFGEEPVEQGLSPTANPDSGAFGASERPSPPVKKDGGLGDAGLPDAGPLEKTYCVGPLKAGDLQINEMLLASRAGALDDGEWIEIRSARTCWLKLRGLVIESPRGGAAPNTVTIAEDFELGPSALFVVADSADPAKNHGLPGKVFAWNATDVLKNDGDTISLKLGVTIIDTVTYPSFSNIEPARTIAFPDNCPARVRSDWARWSLTFNVWKLGFKGTPNATNDDVVCY